MKIIVQKFILPAMLLLVLILSQGSSVSPTPNIYVATSPCDPAVRPVLAIPAETPCEMIRWKIAFFPNPENPSHARYALEYVYGMSKPNTEGLINGGIKATQHGTWKSVKNTGKLPGKNLIELNPENGKTTIVLLQLDEQILHLLDSNGNLMIGNAAWSYTLNKSKNNPL